MWDIPGLSHLIDGLVNGTKWLFKYGRSKKILIVGQGRAGKTSLFDYMRRKVIQRCDHVIPMTRIQNKERMFTLKETTDSGQEIDVEIRLSRDLSGQTFPADQAQWFIDDAPHILFVFIRFDLPLEENGNDIDNVRFWLDEFFSDICDSPRSFRHLARITFVVSRVDTWNDNGHDRRDEFRSVIRSAFEKIPNRKRRSLSHNVYFLQMCHCDGANHNEIKSTLDDMLAESFVRV